MAFKSDSAFVVSPIDGKEDRPYILPLLRNSKIGQQKGKQPGMNLSEICIFPSSAGCNISVVEITAL
jgi:hypothetical protein